LTGIREVAPADWDEALGAHGLNDVYASYGYVSASCIVEPGEPRLLELRDAHGSIFFPLILREIPGTNGLHDVTTPYGYGGPLPAGSTPPWRGFDEAFQRWCARENVVSTFVRFHPRYANEAGASTMEIRALSGVTGWRVDADRDLMAGMHPHHRRLVRKATNAGVRPRVTQGPIELDGFRGLYETTMRRLDASPFYFFDDQYWASLSRDLGDRLVLVESELDGEIVAGALCLGSAPWLHYHLGASDETGRANGANHLALFVAARWAQANGYTTLNLGGGVGGRDDHLFAFKTRFDPEGVLPCFIGTQINDPMVYRRLAGPDADATFFPAYRASERVPRRDVDARSSGA
jgi:serine/alanine adding enzyme